METLKLAITGMSCGHCVASVRRALDGVPGVDVRDVAIGGAELGVRAADAGPATAAALAAVRDAGYEAAVATGDGAGAVDAPAGLTPLARAHRGTETRP